MSTISKLLHGSDSMSNFRRIPGCRRVRRARPFDREDDPADHGDTVTTDDAEPDVDLVDLLRKSGCR